MAGDVVDAIGAEAMPLNNLQLNPAHWAADEPGPDAVAIEDMSCLVAPFGALKVMG